MTFIYKLKPSENGGVACNTCNYRSESQFTQYRVSSARTPYFVIYCDLFISLDGDVQTKSFILSLLLRKKHVVEELANELFKRVLSF